LQCVTKIGNELAYVEALAVKDGKILVMGSKAEVLQTKGDAQGEQDANHRGVGYGFG
jgi:predicted amidohydrolase YtcJ